MRPRLIFFLFAGFVVAAAAPCWAGIAIGTDFPTGSPLRVRSGEISDPMTVSISSNASDIMAGYMVTLQIVPQAGATGSLSFLSPGTTFPTAEPPSYVFASVSHFGIDATNTGGELFFFDFDTGAVPGVTVPGGSGANLLAMTFSASGDALGLFDIVVVPGTVNSEWTDGLFASQDFSNVTGPAPVSIGQVSVTIIPEPGALAIWSMLIAGVGAWRLRRNCRRRCLEHD